MWAYLEAKAIVKAGSGLTYSARVRDNLGAYLTRDDIASIARSIYVQRTAAGVTNQTGVSLDPNNVVFDALQGTDGLDPRWQVDQVGFNFRDMVTAVGGSPALPALGTYVIEWWLTPVAGRGDPFPLTAIVEANRAFAA